MLIRAPNFNVDDNFADVSLFCTSLEPIWQLPAGSAWELNLRNCGYLGPDAAALVFSTWLMGRSLGQSCSVSLPDSPPALKAFCAFSGMNHELSGGPRPRPDHPDSETVPLNHFYQARGDSSLKIVELVKRHSDLSEDNEVYLGAAFNEVVQNIDDHARSQIGGVSCARYFSSSREVRVAVVDRGVGFAGSLLRKLGNLTDREAMQRVFNDGITSQSTSRNQGLGLSNLAKIVFNLKGDLAVYSGTSVAVVDEHHQTPDIRSVNVAFPGTAVFFRLNLGYNVE